MTRERHVYEAEVIRDDEYNANVESRHLGYFPSLELATAAVNAARHEPDWATGSVYGGTLHEAVYLRSPERFEMDDDGSWFVGTDGLAVR
jgi:hypothetical protein